ncbi:PSP1 domain protein [Emticicia oligotrophica DSM 17448]|uniref:PSP1 domain protein n=1 Tax=Emticicia oligotrophica (strain DSM 17448 / CIP 109782 / MTCC 6937 / GPTSA100-15) TaxID=929562 RepID=A0ABN4AMP6_EMTOG|nr:regulatory iron-sulfur-containing complex subunit RicT [Emticicia oligotrophica]AFK03661.1 PSP1 domain protein [Emticicia oligotrophica DSM 17448]
MGCGQCSSGGCGAVKAIGQTEKSNHKTVAGCSSGGCSTGGCNKMNAFDWLSNMDVPRSMRYDVVEVKFKGGRKEYFRNSNNLDLYTGDFVVCEMASGYHIGTVSLQGELVRLQMIKKGIKDNEELRKILRVGTERDLEKHQQSIARDIPTMYRVREIAKELKLQMKMSDVEFQSDNTKATFYYSADDRVDFREMIKILASEFKIRVEMKQISLRQEAARVGGVGSCGRELCCSTWLTDFRAIPTSAARYQNLSLNPAKLSGQCGRLKCCLNYELETYLDALSDIPTVDKPLKTEKGIAVLQKTDIFRRIMWFSYNNDINWHSLPIHQVVEIMKMNENGILPNSLEDLNIVDTEILDKNAPKNSDLDRLDKKYTDKKKQPQNQVNRNQPNRPNNSPQNNQNNKNADSTKVQEPVSQKQHNQGKQNQPQGNNQQGGKPQGDSQKNQGNNQPRGNNQPNNQNKGNNQQANQKQQNQGNNQPKNHPNNQKQGNQNQQGSQPNNQQKQANQPNQQPKQQGGGQAKPNQPQGGNQGQQGGGKPNQNRPNNNQGGGGNQPKHQNNQPKKGNQQNPQQKQGDKPNQPNKPNGAA